MNTSALFVAVPAVDDPAAQGVDDAHISLCFFGEADALTPAMVDVLHMVVAAAAGLSGPFEADVAGTARLGPDSALVLILESQTLADIYTYLCSLDPVQLAQSEATQFPWWIPHMTLAYGADAPIPEPVPKTVKIDQLGFWVAEQQTNYPLAEVETNIAADLTAAALCIPEIQCVKDIPLGIRYAANNPEARWYVNKRAEALGAGELIPWH